MSLSLRAFRLAVGLQNSFSSALRFRPVIIRANSTFQSAVDRLKNVKSADNAQKLKLYALYKQATVGKNTTKKPGMLDMVGKAKWDAWTALGDMGQDEAKNAYVKVVESLEAADGAKSDEKVETGGGLTVTVKDGIRTILMNRPDKFNALTTEMYDGIGAAILEANGDESTKVVVLTGSGKFFCSGNDLGNFANVTDIKGTAEMGHARLKKYVASYIDCKKPLIVLVNGPAVGIAVTVLGLCDAVYCTDSATFQSPFSSLGQSPEGCSSYTFPRIMGYAKASEMLFFNTKITAAQAYEWGLVSQVFPQDRFQVEAWNKVKQIADLPVKSLVYSKELVRGRERELLHKVNLAECDRLLERWQSQDCMEAIMKFFSRKSKV